MKSDFFLFIFGRYIQGRVDGSKQGHELIQVDQKIILGINKVKIDVFTSQSNFQLENDQTYDFSNIKSLGIIIFIEKNIFTF